MVEAQERTDRTAGLKSGTREAAQWWTNAVTATRRELGGGSKAAWHMGHMCSVRHRQCHLLCFNGRLQGNLTTACHSRLPTLDPRDLNTPTFSHPDCSYLMLLPFRLLLYNNKALPSENEGRQHRLLLFLRSKRLRTDFATSSPPLCPLDAPLPQRSPSLLLEVHRRGSHLRLGPHFPTQTMQSHIWALRQLTKSRLTRNVVELGTSTSTLVGRIEGPCRVMTPQKIENHESLWEKERSTTIFQNMDSRWEPLLHPSCQGAFRSGGLRWPL